MDLALRENQLVFRPQNAAPPFELFVESRRVWVFESGELAAFDDEWKRLPGALNDGLRGSGRIEIRSSDGVIAGMDHAGDPPGGALRLTNGDGDPLVINKWGNLARALGESRSARHVLLQRVHLLIDDVRAFGLRPFIMDGTLLGAVRDGQLIAHDDDADLGYLSRHDHPADVALESFALERFLKRRGHDVVRHSASHIQIHRWGQSPFHIDIFGGFHDGTWLMQPFHLRAPLARSVVDDLRPVQIDGHSFDAPHPPSLWLEANYGPGWRTPDPSFRYETPVEVTRRFESWFGTLNLHRDYWNDRFETAGATPRDRTALAALLEYEPKAVLELGFGRAEDARELIERGMTWSGCDYSPVARRVAQDRLGPGVELADVNFLDRRSVMDYILRHRASAGDLHLLISDVVGGLTAPGRENVLLICRHLLKGEGRAFFSFPVEAHPEYVFANPATWHWEIDDFLNDAERFALHPVIHGQTHDVHGRMVATVSLGRE